MATLLRCSSELVSHHTGVATIGRAPTRSDIWRPDCHGWQFWLDSPRRIM